MLERRQRVVTVEKEQRAKSEKQSGVERPHSKKQRQAEGGREICAESAQRGKRIKVRRVCGTVETAP